jgi:hypothetical protein
LLDPVISLNINGLKSFKERKLDAGASGSYL